MLNMLKIDEPRFTEFIIACFDDPIDQIGVTP